MDVQVGELVRIIGEKEIEIQILRAQLAAVNERLDGTHPSGPPDLTNKEDLSES